MRRSSFVQYTAVASLLLLLLPSVGRSWDRGRPTPFAFLPAGAAGPEGLEVDADGDAYVTTFGSPSGKGELFVFDPQGRLVRRVLVENASPNLLGLAFHPSTGALLVIDLGGHQLLTVDPVTGASTPFMTLPAARASGSGLNDLTFDRAGNVYVSDSFQGVIWTTSSTGGEATVWAEDALLRTSGVPPFGANGLRFDSHERSLFVANTGDDTIVRIPVVDSSPGAPGVAGAPTVFANGINGADGLLVDEHDDLWVAANQADEIVVLDPTGRTIAKLGDFDGIGPDGAARGFLFPASLRFRGRDLLVTNLALDLRLVNPSFASGDSAWCSEVTRQSVARIRARLQGQEGARR